MSKKLSIIVTAHTEGLLAHKTMRAVFEGLQPIKAAKIPYEIIVHIDNGDQTTKQYFARYKDDKTIKIYENHFGDPGLSRNFAVSKASGDIITFVDADDLLSPNWLKSAYDLVVSAAEPIIVHPAACLTFGIGIDPVITFYGESLSKKEDAMILLGENRWGIVVMAPKSVFVAHPYIESKNGFGHEDYYFSTETVAAGILHKVAPETILFYRRGNASVLDSNNGSGVVQPYSPLFDEVREDVSSDTRPSESVVAIRRPLYYRVFQRAYRTFLRYFPAKDALRKFAYHFVSHTTNPITQHPFVLREWKNMNHIDTLLCPKKDQINGLVFYSEMSAIECGIKYYELMGKFTQKPAYIFLVPWVNTGGADKVLINYAKAIQKLEPESRVLVITTLPSPNNFKNLLPSNVDFVDFGNAATNLHPFLKDRLFSRIITQAQCRKVHIINSEYGYTWAKNHLAFVKILDLRLSIFCKDFVAGMGQECSFDYGDTYFPLISEAVQHIYTDNHTVANYFKEQYGIDDLPHVTVHYQPVPQKYIQSPRTESSEGAKLRILWASRICQQKHPELLCAIARKLPASKYQIDVYGVMEDGYSADMFAGIPCVGYKGAYKGVSSIDTSRYDVFLYTSISDGMPNVLLEMVSLGLPVIASNAGGIGELIQDNKTGRLISNDDVDAFVSALKSARKDYLPYVNMANSAQKLLKKQHSEAEFVKQVAEMIK